MEKKIQHKRFSAFGIGKERDYFVENLSMLVASGMPILNALDSISTELRSSRMKQFMAVLKEDIESGSAIWKALEKTGLFANHIVSLIKLGEESGKFTENLKMVALEQQKDRLLKSRLHSAMMYPIFVLSLTLVIGVGIAWFILPKLALVFSQLKITLPLVTKILIGVGTFLNDYGKIVVPIAVVAMGLLFFFTFSFSKTKFIGQYIMFSLPIISGLIKEIEIARFGYLLGTLLQAGLAIDHALDSLANATDIAQYKKLYAHLKVSIQDGNSLQKSLLSFKNAKRLVPTPIQQLVAAGERSGSLAETLIKVGETYEVKSDTTTKNLTVILEPILLVIVWLGVVGVALAVILPIYSLVGNFKTQ